MVARIEHAGMLLIDILVGVFPGLSGKNNSKTIFKLTIKTIGI
jgi:hypothetical protein